MLSRVCPLRRCRTRRPAYTAEANKSRLLWCKHPPTDRFGMGTAVLPILSPSAAIRRSPCLFDGLQGCASASDRTTLRFHTVSAFLPSLPTLLALSFATRSSSSTPFPQRLQPSKVVSAPSGRLSSTDVAGMGDDQAVWDVLTAVRAPEHRSDVRGYSANSSTDLRRSGASPRFSILLPRLVGVAFWQDAKRVLRDVADARGAGVAARAAIEAAAASVGAATADTGHIFEIFTTRASPPLAAWVWSHDCEPV